MKLLISIAILIAILALAARGDDKPARAKPLEILDSRPLAEIYPETLKVSYRKGADPRAVVDTLVKSWAQTVQALQACQAAAIEKTK